MQKEYNARGERIYKNAINRENAKIKKRTQRVPLKDTASSTKGHGVEGKFFSQGYYYYIILYYIILYYIIIIITSGKNLPLRPCPSLCPFCEKFITLRVLFLKKYKIFKNKNKNMNKMENKTTILLYRNTVNRLYKNKTKIGDTYDKVLNDILDKYEKENKGK